MRENKKSFNSHFKIDAPADTNIRGNMMVLGEAAETWHARSHVGIVYGLHSLTKQGPKRHMVGICAERMPDFSLRSSAILLLPWPSLSFHFLMWTEDTHVHTTRDRKFTTNTHTQTYS